jgi:hypothetical protein
MVQIGALRALATPSARFFNFGPNLAYFDVFYLAGFLKTRKI